MLRFDPKITIQQSNGRLYAPRAAFSLIELVMALMVMGILTAIAAPRLSSQLDVHSVGSVKTLLQTDLLSAQQEALATSSLVTFSIDKTSHIYTLSAVRNGTSTIIRKVALKGSPWNCQVTSLLKGSAKTSVSSSALSINGAGVFGEDLVINLACGTSSAMVTVASASGRVLAE